MERHLTIYYTSDIHGCFSPVQYATGKQAPSGLANCLSQFQKDGNTLIIDGGDTLQGSPLTYYLSHEVRDVTTLPAQLLNLGAILTVSSQNDAAVLNGVAETLGVQAQVHIKIDTGMGRYGFLPDELDQLLPIFKYMPGLHVTGIYTHLHSAFCNQKATIAQAEAFQGVLDKLHAEGCGTGMAHMLNSAGLLKYPEYAMDGVRVGSAILGRVSVRGNWGLARIGECQATVEELRWLPKGHSCGYGAGWTAKKPTRVAVFSVGWYHGFGVEMGNDLFRFRDCLRGILRNLKQMIFKKHLYVTVNGKKCRVLGHIGMLHTCVDVTNLPCAVGDTAVFDIKPLLLKGIEVVYR